MKEAPWIIGFIFIALTITLIVTFYSRETYRHESIIQTINETAKVAVISELDRSSRIKSGTNELVVPDFEERFKQEFTNNLNVKMTVKNYKFEYLTEDQVVKSIWIQVTDDRGNNYQATFATGLV